ncbi:MAG: hypothetical protein II943_05295 [Victivallales bacterium]|nr:hypothetical protein [Victivallales bacterium]
MTAKITRANRRRVVFSLLGGLAICISYVLVVGRCGFPIRQLPEGLTFRDGDIILLGSSTFRGRLLRIWGKGEEWSHVGLATTLQDGSIGIIHADPDEGVVRQLLSEYLLSNNVDALALLRTSGYDGHLAVSYAEQAVRSNTPFDHSFCYKSNDGVYCTELVLLAWENAGIVLLPEAKYGDRIPPSELLQSSQLTCMWRLHSEK